MDKDNHQHIDNNGDGKCDKCGTELCQHSKPQGAMNLICTRKKDHKDQHYDRGKRIHF